jgi:hypothetical protein
VTLTAVAVRVPLGASSAPAASAERLQFTVGEGPCPAPLQADSPEQEGPAEARRLPMLFQQRTAHNPYRSVFSVPTNVAGTSGAVDFYFLDPRGSAGVDLDDGVTVAEQIGDVLSYTAGIDCLRTWPPAPSRPTSSAAADLAAQPWALRYLRDELVVQSSWFGR